MSPAISETQRRMMGIASHHPEQLYERNKAVLKMGVHKLREFASTKEKGLPYHKAANEAVRRAR
jgi:hypothetical protein